MSLPTKWTRLAILSATHLDRPLVAVSYDGLPNVAMILDGGDCAALEVCVPGGRLRMSVRWPRLLEHINDRFAPPLEFHPDQSRPRGTPAEVSDV